MSKQISYMILVCYDFEVRFLSTRTKTRITDHGDLVTELSHWMMHSYQLTHWSVDKKCTVISRQIYSHVVALSIFVL